MSTEVLCSSPTWHIWGVHEGCPFLAMHAPNNGTSLSPCSRIYIFVASVPVRRAEFCARGLICYSSVDRMFLSFLLQPGEQLRAGGAFCISESKEVDSAAMQAWRTLTQDDFCLKMPPALRRARAPPPGKNFPT
eukprot:scaffold277022_cov15-Tisochrysis_lutea.AAC.1